MVGRLRVTLFLRDNRPEGMGRARRSNAIAVLVGKHHEGRSSCIHLALDTVLSMVEWGRKQTETACWTAIKRGGEMICVADPTAPWKGCDRLHIHLEKLRGFSIAVCNLP